MADRDVDQLEHPFTEEDLQRVQDALRRIDAAERLTERARQAGLDVGDYPQQLRQLKDQLLRIKQTFWPGR